MAVYVDDLFPVMRGQMKKYGHSCHLLADSDEELEQFARRIKLRRGWKHGDHYDLTPARRVRAVAAGAVEATSEDLVKIRKRARA